MLLDHAYDESGTWGKKLIPNWKQFKKEQVQLRHSGAHGKNEASDYGIMWLHYQGQIAIAYFIFLQRLGLPEEAINAFEGSSFLNVARWRVASHYALSD